MRGEGRKKERVKGERRLKLNRLHTRITWICHNLHFSLLLVEMQLTANMRTITTHSPVSTFHPERKEKGQSNRQEITVY